MPGFVTLTDPTGAVELVTLDPDDCRLLAFPAQQLADRARVNGAPAGRGRTVQPDGGGYRINRHHPSSHQRVRHETSRRLRSGAVTSHTDGARCQRTHRHDRVDGFCGDAERSARRSGAGGSVSEEDAEKMEHRNAS